ERASCWTLRRRSGGRLGWARTPGCGALSRSLTLGGALAALHQQLDPAIELGQRAGDLVVVTLRLGDPDGRARRRKPLELLRERTELGAHRGVGLGRRRMLAPLPVVSGFAGAIAVAASGRDCSLLSLLACRLLDHRIKPLTDRHARAPRGLPRGLERVGTTP